MYLLLQKYGAVMKQNKFHFVVKSNWPWIELESDDSLEEAG